MDKSEILKILIEIKQKEVSCKTNKVTVFQSELFVVREDQDVHLQLQFWYSKNVLDEVCQIHQDKSAQYTQWIEVEYGEKLDTNVHVSNLE